MTLAAKEFLRTLYKLHAEYLDQAKLRTYTRLQWGTLTTEEFQAINAYLDRIAATSNEQFALLTKETT